MIDTVIGFCDAKILCFVGTLPHEQLKPQEILLSLTVALSAHPSETLLDVDYAVLHKLCEATLLERHHPLIETQAARILDALEKKFHQKITWAQVRIEKAGALPHTRCAFVEIKRIFL